MTWLPFLMGGDDINKWENEVLESQYESERKVMKELESQYQSALRQIKNTIRLLQSDELTQSRIYRIQHQKALQKQIEAILEQLHTREFETISAYLEQSYSDAYIGSMYSLHKQGVPLVIPINQESVVRAVVTDSKLSAPLYTALGYEMDKLKKSVREQISRGIASALSYDEIARNISDRTSISLASAERVARTEVHRINCQAQYESALESKKRGADIVKQWSAVRDGDVRSSHKRLDGQIRELEEKFSNGLLFPGHKIGKPEEVINCRCVANIRARWALNEAELQRQKDKAAFFGLDKTDDFNEFKAKYLNASKTLEPPGKIRYNIGAGMARKTDETRRTGNFISNERFESLVVPIKKQGAIIIKGTKEANEYLDKRKAAAITIGDVILFRDDVLISEVLEESRHFMQNAIHLNDDKGEPLRSILNEIEAKEYLLTQTKKYKIPRAEVETTKKQLESYKKQLQKITGEGE